MQVLKQWLASSKLTKKLKIPLTYPTSMTPYEIWEAESMKKSASFAQHYKTPKVQILQNKHKNFFA